MASPPTQPSDEPLHYVEGGWPDGTVRELAPAEGGELVRYQVDQLRLFVAELAQVREDRGVTKASLARMTGLRSNTISDLEAGRTYPDWSTIARIAYALDADLRFAARPSRRPEVAEPR
jgi:DNA-binding XRE family transcriptional regulator